MHAAETNSADDNGMIVILPVKKSVAMLFALFASLLALAVSCATKPMPAIPDYPSLVSLSFDAVAVKLVQADVAGFEFSELVKNRSDAALKLISAEHVLSLDGVPYTLDSRSGGIQGAGTLLALSEIRGFIKTDIKLTAPASSLIGGGSQPESSWRLSSTLMLEDAGGHAFALLGETAGKVPRLILPALAIESITVRKMELINTKLKVDIVVRNENYFPLVLDAFDYALYGEGRFWARGRTAEEIVVAARSDKKIALELVMNFADMDRSVLDKVIYMKQVLCRLSGRIRLRTTLEFLPEFELPFSVEGEAPVAR